MNEYITQALSYRYHQCQWIDATSMIVKIHQAALPSIIAYVQNSPTEDFGRLSEKCNVLRFFQNLYRNTQIESSGGFQNEQVLQHWHQTKNKFLCELNVNQLPVIWYTHIKPTQSSKFLIHYLLKNGSFTNEMDLMTSGNIQSAYIKARLFSPETPNESIKHLCKQYIWNKLSHLPGSNKQFDKYVVAIYKLFESVLIHARLPASGTPPFLYTRLITSAAEDVQRLILELRTNGI